MVKTILLRCDNGFFQKMKEDKVRKERIFRRRYTWEEYIKLLFGFAKYIKLEGGR